MDSTITRLLIATKALLEGLAEWSKGKVSADHISQIYVKLGNDFNVACAAFAKEQIGMSELLSVPSDLRACLESCLSDPPSQETLERHLPQVRQIIIGLLTGLREKQKIYREGVSARRTQGRDGGDRRDGDDSGRRGSDASSVGVGSSRSSLPQNPITPNSASRQRDELRKFVSQAQSATQPSSRPPATLPNLPPQNFSASEPSPFTVPASSGVPSNPRSRISSGGTERRTPSLPDATSPPFSPPLVSVPLVNPPARTVSQSRSSTSIRDSARSRTSADVGPQPLPDIPMMKPSRSSGSLSGSLGNFSSERQSTGDRRGSPPPPAREAEKPVPVPTTPISELYPQAVLSPGPRPPSVHSTEESMPSPFEGTQTAKQMESFEALKSSDNLSRRASKRFSAYAINKITSGSPSRGDGLGSSVAGRELSKGVEDKRALASSIRRGKSELRGSRSDKGPPPVPSLPTSISDRDLRAPPTIVEEEFYSPDPNSASPQPGPSSSYFPPTSNVTSPQVPSSSFSINSAPLPPIPASSPAATSAALPAPSKASSSPRDFVPPSDSSPTFSSENAPGPSTSSRARTSVATSELYDGEPEFPISVYLQIGRDVKKAKLEEPPTLSTLRALFIERFSYNPGHADFPNIYLRDAIVGVQYELEDMSEVKNGSVISLNIDTVEQVKQHIDQGLSGLTQEIKELRATVSAMRRASVSAAAAALSPNPETSSPVISVRPSERQFQDAAQKVLRTNTKRVPSSTSSIPEDSESAPSSSLARVAAGEGEAAPSSPTSSAGGDNRAPHVVAALKSQHEEVQSLRREIGVLRQIYVDFTSQTKSTISSVRAQTSHVSHLAATKVSTARAFIDAGKVKLETETTDLIARGDTLQDAIDDMRADIVRKIRPRPQQLTEIAKSLEEITKERDALISWVATVKPSWKATWSDELETIISEQKLLEAQEGFLSELQVDMEEAASLFKTIQEVAHQPKSSKPRQFTVQTTEDPAGGLSNVLMEVRGLQPDADRRLEAIARAEKAREAELASRTDEFAEELGDFVSGSKLRKSGGVEETERLRQAKSDAALKTMFAGVPE
ncbi:actin-interacting protein 3 [Pseudohyphozyma bogoriensis]|nr:actin-interacting protein 3 [Pseudohyphozyma bogoriensis]